MHLFDIEILSKIFRTISSITDIASSVCSASFLISLATTENPLPASPALAASIAALSANKFV